MKHDYNLEIFFKREEVYYYLLGVIMMDGCISIYPKYKTLTISSKDKDWLEDIKDLIAPTVKLHKVSKDSNCWVLKIGSTKLCNFLITEGVTPRKSLTLKFPNVPAKYIGYFIQGCLDGDGSWHFSFYSRLKNNKQYNCVRHVCYLASSSVDFTNSYSILLTQQGIKNNILQNKTLGGKIKDRQITRKHTAYRVQVSNKSIIKLCNLINNNLPICLKRKQNIVQQIINHYSNE